MDDHGLCLADLAAVSGIPERALRKIKKDQQPSLKNQRGLVAAGIAHSIEDFGRLPAAIQCCVEEKGISYLELAEQAGLHWATLQRLRRGMHLPHPETLAKLAEAGVQHPSVVEIVEAMEQLPPSKRRRKKGPYTKAPKLH